MRGSFKLARRFADDERGAVAILFGLSCIFLFGLIGLSIDVARYYNYTSRLQTSLDAAALAGAKLLPEDTVTDAEIKSLINANFSDSMSRAGVKIDHLDPPAISIDRATKTIEVESKAKIPALFSMIIGSPKHAEISRKSKVVFDMQKVELSLVLDITGSMGSSNKLDDLKAAANELVDDLYNVSPSEDAVRIALAPYSASVNTGSLASSVMDLLTVPLDNCVIERRGANAAKAVAPKGLDKLPHVPSLKYGNYTCPSASVLPLQGKSKKDVVKATINNYAAAGATAGQIGTAWGWYLVSPDWASVLPADSTPAPYSDPVNKTVVIMTDGEFNTSYTSGVGVPASVQADQSYKQFDRLCDNMKAQGINVYTIGFALTDSRALSELESCASVSGNFFDAKTGADLKNAFKDIAAKLNALRIAG